MTATVGQCFLEGTYVETDVVDCGQPHRTEAYDIEDSTATEFTDLDTLESEARAICIAAFSTFVGIDITSSNLYVDSLTPTELTWQTGDRRIGCFVGDNDGLVTGTLKGAAR